MIKSYKLRRFLSNTFIYVLLAVLGLIWVSPLVYLVLHSFRDEGLAYVSYLIPKKLSFQNYINLFLDHLMSRLVFNMKISPTYDAVRTIKVKKMTLKLADISSMSVTVTFSDNHGISAISYLPTGAAANSCIIENEEKTLTTSPAAICTGYMVPDNVFINKLELETEFEVYNKKGNKIAERTAVNKLTEPLAELQRGEERTLLLTIDPSYLYVLSDPDLDNPTITIDN